jgi:hypothetical protein
MDIGFAEEMAGTYRGVGTELKNGKFRFVISVDCVNVSDPRVVKGDIVGQVFMDGVVDGAPLKGTIEISPLWKRRIAYAFTFPVDGKTWQFKGTKKVSFLRPVHTMTVLPGGIFDNKGRQVAEATTTFNIRRDLFSFLKSYRFSAQAPSKSTTMNT